MLIALRPASVTDLAFIYEVTEASMRGYVEQTWGQWDRALQFPLGQKANLLRSNSSRRWLASRNSLHEELFKNIVAKAE
jgi:hypothetical protein